MVSKYTASKLHQSFSRNGPAETPVDGVSLNLQVETVQTVIYPV